MDLIIDKKLLERTNRDISNEELLFSMLLYDTLWVSSEFEFDKSILGKTLQKEGVIKVIPKKYHENSTSSISSLINKGTKSSNLIIGYEDMTLQQYISLFEGVFDDKEKLYNSWLEIEEAKGEKQFYEDYISTLLGLFREIIWEGYSVLQTPNKIKNPEFFNDTQINFPFFLYHEKFNSVKDILSYLHESKNLRELHQLGMEGIEEDIEKLYYINEFVYLKELLEYSLDNSLPIKLNLPTVKGNLNESPIWDDNTYRIYKIIIEEINFLPKLRSIEDVFRLREKSEIIRFRELLHHYNHLLYSGDFSLEDKFRKDLKKANREIKRLPNVQKIGGWITYVSLPFIAIDIALGLPIGSLITAVGGAYQIKADSIKRKYSWLLFGNSV